MAVQVNASAAVPEVYLAVKNAASRCDLFYLKKTIKIAGVNLIAMEEDDGLMTLNLASYAAEPPAARPQSNRRPKARSWADKKNAKVRSY